VARQLQALGFDTAALKGGYNAWQMAFPVEPKGGPPGDGAIDAPDAAVREGRAAAGERRPS
jgi:hypothetical protein